MAKHIDALRDAIGTANFNKIKALASKAKAAGRSPDQIKIDIQKKLGNDIKIKEPLPIIWMIISHKGR